MTIKLTRLDLDYILTQIQMAEAGQVPVNWWHSGSSDFGARNDGYGKERVFFDVARKILHSRFSERYAVVRQPQYAPTCGRRPGSAWNPKQRKRRLLLPHPMTSS